MGVLTHLAYYPTLAYNLTRHHLDAHGWQWYSRIDDLVVLGAMPFKKTAEQAPSCQSVLSEFLYCATGVQLIDKERIGAVVSLTEPWEMNHAWLVDGNNWEARGVHYYWLPTRDYIHAPQLDDLRKAVQFILR